MTTSSTKVAPWAAPKRCVTGPFSFLKWKG